VGELQRALLPRVLPQIAGLEAAVSYEPSGRAGGDLYDFFSLDESDNDPGDAEAAPSRWCVFIGDATGHGLAAAVVMAIVQSVLHAHPIGIVGPANLLVHANRQLCRKNIHGFVTAFLGIYEPLSRRLTYVNAGHPPPLLRRWPDAGVLALNAVASYPLGIDASETFKEASVQIEPGDTVLLYTDGITEASGAQGELFGQDRLTSVMCIGGDRPVELIERLRAAVRAHERGQTPKDDQTLVAARVL
jgi:sigma-B regulation protein RsbU (phosphoserine phosphatase)